MRALKEARRFIQANPHDNDARLLARLALALGTEAEFSVRELYEIKSKDRFELALRILEQWHLDRHYAAKLRLFDISQQAQSVPDTRA